MAQVRLADLVGKTIDHCFVPADQKAVTFVLKEGRMSLGAAVVRLRGAANGEGSKILSTTGTLTELGFRELEIVTNNGSLVVEYEGADALTELPE